jgi:hypothetical protein
MTGGDWGMLGAILQIRRLRNHAKEDAREGRRLREKAVHATRSGSLKRLERKDGLCRASTW